MVLLAALALLLILAATAPVDSFEPSFSAARKSGAHRRESSAFASQRNLRCHMRCQTISNANPGLFGRSVGSNDGWAQPRNSREGLAGWSMRSLPRTRKVTASRLREATSTAQHGAASQHPRMGELTPPEAKVYNLLHELHAAGFAFRVVVVGGRGSIAEFTVARLGPKLTVAQSPSTGANLLTLAAEDASWEYHVQLSEVFKVALVEKQTPAKTLRIVRLVNATGDTVSSLILVPDYAGHDKSEQDAIQWFHGLVEKYGSEIQL